MSQLYLAHHGIKGMRWGIRRYQNADGSLTDAGRKRLKKSIKDPMLIKNQGLYKKHMPSDKSTLDSLKKIKRDVKNAEDIIGQDKYKKYGHDVQYLTDKDFKKWDASDMRAHAEAKKMSEKILGKYANMPVSYDKNKTYSDELAKSIIKDTKESYQKYRKQENIQKAANNLFNKSPQLKRDFGSINQVDDMEYLLLTAKDYGLNTSELEKAMY